MYMTKNCTTIEENSRKVSKLFTHPGRHHAVNSALSPPHGRSAVVFRMERAIELQKTCRGRALARHQAAPLFTSCVTRVIAPCAYRYAQLIEQPFTEGANFRTLRRLRTRHQVVAVRRFNRHIERAHE